MNVKPKINTSAGLASSLSDETGTGAAVFGTSPALVTPTITGDITGDGSYFNQLQNIPDLASKGAAYWFDGVDDYIFVGDSDQLTMVTAGEDNAFSIVVLAQFNATSGNYSIFGKYNGAAASEYEFLVSSNLLYVNALESDAGDKVGRSAPFTSTTRNWLAAVYTGSETSSGFSLYLNGNEISTADDESGTYTGMSNTNANVMIGRRDNNTLPFNGQISRTLLFNLALTAAEVQAYSSGAPVPFKYIGASQTELIDDSDNTDFDDGTINEWVVSLSGGGNGTLDYDAGPGAVKTAKVTVGATAGATTAGSLPGTNFGGGTLIGGKTYSVAADVYIVSGANNFTSIEIVLENTNGVENVAKRVLATLGTEDVWQTVSAEYTMAGTDLVGNLRVRGYSTTTGDIFYFDNVSVIQIGAVLQLEQDGIGHNQWQDSSGNQLVGAVSGAIPINLPVDAQETYLDLTMTGDTSFTLPKGYQVKSIIFKSDGAIGGGLDVGTTDGGGELVAAEAISGAVTVLATLIDAVTIGGTFATADDTLYVTDADGTGWDGASVELRVQMQRLTTN